LVWFSTISSHAKLLQSFTVLCNVQPLAFLNTSKPFWVFNHAFTLSEKFEEKLEQHSGNLLRAAAELAQDWRSDKLMRKLEALLIALDEDHLLIISGGGEVIEKNIS
jgi:hypothetical protein